MHENFFHNIGPLGRGSMSQLQDTTVHFHNNLLCQVIWEIKCPYMYRHNDTYEAAGTIFLPNDS